MPSSLINYSPSCERNQSPILSVLQPYLDEQARVLEIGSYSGQHAIYFCKHALVNVWQTSDTAQYVTDLALNLNLHSQPNLIEPLLVDVAKQSTWPQQDYNRVFTANTLHIMSWSLVKQFFKLVEQVLEPSGMLFVYGPFNYGGEFTSKSNADFEQWLKQRDPASGIRHFEDIVAQAQLRSLRLVEDITMPANNRMLIFTKS
ncbi:DUF938 domain-containing protein [Thalassotalea fusca]